MTVHAQFTHAWLKLHSDFDLCSFRDCQEKDNRIMVAEQCLIVDWSIPGWPHVGMRGHWVGRLLVLWITGILDTNIETG